MRGWRSGERPALVARGLALSRGAMLAVALAGAACEAAFEDLRPGDLDGDGGFAAGRLDEAPEAVGETVVATGRFTGRDGHFGTGGATLGLGDDGVWRLRFGRDFVVTPVPAPVVVLSRDDDLGPRLGADDLQLAVLSRDRGEQAYRLSGEPGDRRVVWVFCKPYGVEVARAILDEAR